MAIRNYVFHAKIPTGNLAKVEEQMLLAHRYYNKLIEIEKEYHAAREALLGFVSPEFSEANRVYVDADAAVILVYEKIRAIRQKARRRIEIPSELASELKVAKQARNDALDAMKLLRKAAWQEAKRRQDLCKATATAEVGHEEASLKPKAYKQKWTACYLRHAAAAGVDGGQQAYHAAAKAARATCGVYWGTYIAVEERVAQAVQAAAKFGETPRFRRWENTGAVAVQLQPNLAINDAYAGNSTLLRLPLRNREELETRGKSRGMRAISEILIRIGSEPDKSPTWATVPVLFDRPIPTGACIKQAFLHKKRTGDHYFWELQLVLSMDVAARERPNEKMVAVHLGWRRIGDETRIATTFATDGDSKEYFIPNELVTSGDLCDRLRSHRDARLNSRLSRLRRWLEENKAILPEWLQKASANIGRWKNASPFAYWARYWLEHRFPGDETIIRFILREPPDNSGTRPWMRGWLARDRHLSQWEADQRAKTQRKREIFHRTLAKQIAKEYGYLAIANVNWAQLGEKARDDQDADVPSEVRRAGKAASPGTFVQILKAAFDGEVTSVPASDITLVCNACGVKNKPWSPSQRMHTCVSCGREWDQDVNAAKNTLARAIVARKYQGSLAPSQTGNEGCPEPEISGGNDSKSAPARKSRRNRFVPKALG